jgi:hypothetical protein
VTPRRIDTLKRASDSAVIQPSDLYQKVLHDPAKRDARAYLISAAQPDFPTAVKFVNALIKNGITVERATAAFEVKGKRYPAGSFVVKTAQAFRPHILDMFEPQDHPNDLLYPGGPPVAPYDISGWTLAMQMGVEFDRSLEPVSGPFAILKGLAEPPAERVEGSANPAGWVISHRQNDAFIIMNRLLKAGCEVEWLAGDGAMWVPVCGAGKAIVEKGASQLGVSVRAVAAKPEGAAVTIKPVRVGLYDQYGGLITSGWTRWLFEQFEIPYEVVYPQALDAGALREKFDVLVLPDGAAAVALKDVPVPLADLPKEYLKTTGRITVEKTIPQLKRFVESGGRVITIGDANDLAAAIGVPAQSVVAGLGRDKFYVPGALLRVAVDNTKPLAWGMPSHADVFFDSSPAWKAGAGQARVAWFDSPEPLMSGWAWGQKLLEGTTAIQEVALGEGRIVMLGPEVAFRGQPHGTFKFLFNALYLSQ